MRNPQDRTAAIVTTSVALARRLGLTVVAEGVETEKARLQLASIDCDVIQGYLLSRPLPAAEVTPLLRLGATARAQVVSPPQQAR